MGKYKFPQYPRPRPRPVQKPRSAPGERRLVLLLLLRASLDTKPMNEFSRKLNHVKDAWGALPVERLPSAGVTLPGAWDQPHMGSLPGGEPAPPSAPPPARTLSLSDK